MKKKRKETSIGIPAYESLHNAIKSISNGYKDRKNLGFKPKHQWIKNQDKALEKEFSNAILTMKQASLNTGIDRSNICRFVQEKREKNSIWMCGKDVDILTNHRAGFLTTNKELAVKFFMYETRQFWETLPEEEQVRIYLAVTDYLSVHDLGVFVSSSMSNDDKTLEAWHKVQEYIDQRMTEK